MSKNIDQVFISNPITTNASTDLMYFGQSPYGAGNDAAMTYSNFSAQFTLKIQTTKGDLIGYSTLPVRVGVGSNGQLLQSDSTAAAGISWSTVTFPTTSGASGSIIISNGTNWITSSSLWPNTVGTSGLFLISNGTSNVYSTSTIPTSAGATVGKILASDGTNYVLSTPSFPVASATSGKIIQSDGTNWVASGATWPTAATNGKFVIGNGTNYVESTSTIPTSAGATANKVLLSDGTNYVLSTPTFPNASATSGKIIISDGTNWIASTPTYPNTSGTAGKILRSDGTNNVYSTSTFADTYAVSTLLYAGSSNAVSGLTTVNSASLTTNATGVPTWLAQTDGQIIIGSSAGAPAAANITASGNISVTNGHNTIALATTGLASFAWNDVSGTSQSAAVNNGYIISNAGQTTVTLPATAAEGSVFSVQGKGAAGWILQANTGQTIHLGSSATSSAGSLTSTNQWDSVSIVCVTANTTFAVTSVIGNLTVA
jgi:hypothetical protein